MEIIADLPLYKPYERRNTSLRWQVLRAIAFARDDYSCLDCGSPATEVHHTSYENLNTPLEIFDLKSQCHDCHKIKGLK